jgi:antitoxin ParD1/3/4
MHVSLTAKLEKFVKAKVNSGLYNNASEVVREALRLMREHEELQRLKRARLRDALEAGEADLKAGRATRLADDGELAAFFARL